jgi:KipI family sensor histidine kinase inhibitor
VSEAGGGRGAPRVLPCGPGALLVEVGSTQEALRLYAAARASALDVTDIVPAARTVLFDGVADLRRLEGWLADLDLADGATAPVAGRTVEVPTRYDGADLGEVARSWDMTRAEAVATHTGLAFSVAFCGFVPGFAYCTGLPAPLHLARLPEPRPRVPAGSVAVAGEFTGVYPTASPGGWRLLGTTELTLWDATAQEPAALVPGAAVRFVEVSG